MRGNIKGNIIKGTALLIVLCGIFFLFKPKNKYTGERSPYTVRKEVSQNKIEISGYIEAAEQQKFLAPGEGIVEVINVKQGSKVKKGDLILALDASEQLFKLSEQEFIYEQEKINGASRKLQMMERQIKLLKKQVDDRRIYAKFDGTVVAFNCQQGQYAKAQDNFGTLINRSFLKSTVEIVESDAGGLQPKQKVSLAFPAQPNLKIEGYIVSFPSIARITQRGATVLDTEIRIDNPPEEILPGYSFHGSVITGDDEEILIVEQNGIRYEKGMPVVDKIEGNKEETVPVVVEPYVSGIVKIISGLKEGDIIKNHSTKDSYEMMVEG